jgi:hypothetical protein
MKGTKQLFGAYKVLLGLLMCSMLSCADDLDVTALSVTGAPHDPRKPIEVTDFEPKTGTSGQQMVIYGKNFGSDPSLIQVNIGGSDAVVVSANGDAIYCLVPTKSAMDDFDGFDYDDEDDEEEEVEESANASVTRAIDEDEAEINGRTIHVAVGAHGYYQETSYDEERFVYKRAWKVRTIAGKVDEKRTWDFRVSKTPLPFDDCGNFPKCDNFIIDPVNPDHLWVSCDVGGGIRMFDLRKKEVTFFSTAEGLGASNNRVRNMEFTHDSNHNLVVATEQSTDTAPTIFLIKRNSPDASGVEAFKTNDVINSRPLIATRSCMGLAIHPITNSIFFPKGTTTEYYKFPNHKAHPELKGDKMGIYNWVDQGTIVKSTDPDMCEMQFGFGESNYEMVPYIHPTGKYMYVITINLHYIAKTFYNATADTFGLPVWFVNSSGHAGLGGYGGYVDDIGMEAKVNRPREGVFVKNPEYKGQDDEYDFYFSDQMNHCIRKVTPQGIVTTFAGRGRVSDGNAYGYADGLARGEALMNQPHGITYSETLGTFLIGDLENMRIREIYYD